MPTDVQNQIKELEARLQQLRSAQVTELQEELRAARRKVAEIEAKIAEITGKPAASASTAGAPRRRRTSSEEVRGRILKALSQSPEGLSQKEISNQSGLNYNTVVLYLKNNAKEFKTTGQLRSKRYFLK